MIAACLVAYHPTRPRPLTLPHWLVKPGNLDGVAGGTAVDELAVFEVDAHMRYSALLALEEYKITCLQLRLVDLAPFKILAL